jgi:phosphoglycolate phosphatase
MPKINYIVTDLNGTLVDAMSAYTRIFGEVVKKHTGVDSPKIAAYSVNATGTPWDEQFAHVLETYQKSREEAPQMMSEFCELVNREKYALYPGAAELLRKYKREGRKIFITSGSNTGAMIKRIYELGIFPQVDYLLGFDIYKKGPKHIMMLAEKEGLTLDQFARQAVYFGDGPGDMLIAKECWLYAIGVAQTVGADKLQTAGADRVIERIGQALELDIDWLVA